jgi:hypothetical protein
MSYFGIRKNFDDTKASVLSTRWLHAETKIEIRRKIEFPHNRSMENKWSSRVDFFGKSGGLEDNHSFEAH